VLYWPRERVLVAADLHLEKGSFYATRGIVLPPYDTRTTLRSLTRAVNRYRPRTVIALGDSFHDMGGAARLDRCDQEAIRALTAAHEFVWVAGNHDPEPPRDLGGDSVPELNIGPLFFRHEPLALPQIGEVAGHLHPCAKLRLRGRSLRRRCFATDGNRLVMPALGAYAGGLNVLDKAFAPLFGARVTAWMLGDEAAYPIDSHRLRADG